MAKGVPGKSSGTMGLPRTRVMTGGGVTSSSPGMNSTGVKFSVLNGLLVGRTRTTRTPVGPSLVSGSAVGLVTPPTDMGCLALGLELLLSGGGSVGWTNLVGSVFPMVPTGLIRTLAPLMVSSVVC